MTQERVLVIVPLMEEHLARLGEAWSVTQRTRGRGGDSTLGQGLEDVQVVVTNGSIGITADEMDQLPSLGMICAFGAGYENIDLAAADARGIVVANAPGVNDTTVADHALALALVLARDIVRRDHAVRTGRWLNGRYPSATLSGATVGIIGLGRIGGHIARRANSFEARVLYHARRARSDVPWQYRDSARALAADADFLIAACPGGPGTYHIVNADVLEALGPQGFLINVSRGTVVDTKALSAALASRSIAGAALDVLENEPDVPEELLACENVVFTPHVAGRSHAAMEAQFDALSRALQSFFAGEPVAHRIVEHAAATP